MSIFVALIGLLGMAVFFIQGIVFLFQRKQIKKPLMYFVVSFVIGFVGILMTPPAETSDKPVNEQPKTEGSVEKPVEKPAKKPSDETNKPTVEVTEKVEAAETPKTEKPVSKPEQVKDENKNKDKAEESTKPSNKKEPTTADPIKKPEEVSVPESKEYTLLHGDLLSTNKNGNGIVIKAKIKPNLTNKLTISQNFYNIEDLIKNQGADQLDEIQYWAVADMSNGSEEKVISFTVDKELISALLNRKVFPNELQDYVSDLWIHGSLK